LDSNKYEEAMSILEELKEDFGAHPRIIELESRIRSEIDLKSALDDARLALKNGDFQRARKLLKQLPKGSIEVDNILSAIAEKEKAESEAISNIQKHLGAGKVTKAFEIASDFIKDEGSTPQLSRLKDRIEKIRKIRQLGLELEGGRTWFLPIRTGVIGRGEHCPIQIPDKTKKVSREHCKISIRGDKIIIEDLGSTNHTYLDNEEVKKGKLKDSGEIGLGITKKVSYQVYRKGDNITLLVLNYSEPPISYLLFDKEIRIGIRKGRFLPTEEPVFIIKYQDGNFFIRAIRRRELYLNSEEVKGEVCLALDDSIEVRGYRIKVITRG